jgi:uncharacterized membrane protein
METLNEPREERELGIPFLLFTVVLGFVFMAFVLFNTFLAFHWFEERHASDPILYGLGLLFLAFLSLFAFAVQGLLQTYIDNSAVYFFGGTFLGIYLSSLLLFLYCLRTTDIQQKVSRRSAVYLEITFFMCTIAALVVTMIVSAFVSTAYQNYVMYGLLVVLSIIHTCTRTNTTTAALLPMGFPKERIDVFTDGVYAVAVTLFLIEIKYPAHTSHETVALVVREDYVNYVFIIYINNFTFIIYLFSSL